MILEVGDQCVEVVPVVEGMVGTGLGEAGGVGFSLMAEAGVGEAGEACGDGGLDAHGGVFYGNAGSRVDAVVGGGVQVNIRSRFGGATTVGTGGGEHMPCEQGRQVEACAVLAGDVVEREADTLRRAVGADAELVAIRRQLADDLQNARGGLDTVCEHDGDELGAALDVGVEVHLDAELLLNSLDEGAAGEAVEVFVPVFEGYRYAEMAHGFYRGRNGEDLGVGNGAVEVEGEEGDGLGHAFFVAPGMADVSHFSVS